MLTLFSKGSRGFFGAPRHSRGRTAIWLLGFFVTIAISTTGGAATFERTVAISLNAYDQLASDLYAQDFTIALPALAVGDVIDTTILFVGGQQLRIESAVAASDEAVGVLFFPDIFASGNVLTSNSLEYLDLSGELVPGNPQVFLQACSTCVSAEVISNQTDSFISFSGLRITSTISAIPNPFGVSVGRLYVRGMSNSTIEIVPEPSPALMVALGLVLISTMGRCRSNG